MKTELTSKERITRMYEHRDADRIPIWDYPWAGTIRRWVREGMPEGIDWRDYFGVDKTDGIVIDVSPRYEEKVLESTPRYEIVTTSFGVTLKRFKEEDSTPEFLNYSVTDADAWQEAKKRLTLDDDRIPWDILKKYYDLWQAEGRWVYGLFWFGFDVTHSWMMGLENVLCAMVEEPELIKDIFGTFLNNNIALFDRVWDAGYHFDEVFWYDDMGYRNRPFFSPAMYRELVMPFHKKAVDWAHAHGIRARLHSCGDVMTLLPDIVSTGVDALNPLEIKAGMDPIQIKKQYGDRLVLHGGINAAIMDRQDQVLAEMEHLIPVLKENGGYIFASDHTIPNSVSLQDMKFIVDNAKRLGKY